MLEWKTGLDCEEKKKERKKKVGKNQHKNVFFFFFWRKCPMNGPTHNTHVETKWHGPPGCHRVYVASAGRCMLKHSVVGVIHQPISGHSGHGRAAESIQMGSFNPQSD